MLARPIQPENAPLSIIVTEFGIVTLRRPVHPLNASYPIAVTVLGITTFVISL